MIKLLNFSDVIVLAFMFGVGGFMIGVNLLSPESHAVASRADVPVTFKWK